MPKTPVITYVQCASHPNSRWLNSPTAGIPVKDMLAGYIAAARQRDERAAR